MFLQVAVSGALRSERRPLKSHRTAEAWDPDPGVAGALALFQVRPREFPRKTV